MHRLCEDGPLCGSGRLVHHLQVPKYVEEEVILDGMSRPVMASAGGQPLRSKLEATFDTNIARFAHKVHPSMVGGVGDACLLLLGDLVLSSSHIPAGSVPFEALLEVAPWELGVPAIVLVSSRSQR